MSPADDRQLPKLTRVDGRAQEYIVLADGSRVTALFIPHLMKDFPSIEGYQIVQQDNGHICMHIMTHAANWDACIHAIQQAIDRHMPQGLVCTYKKVEQLYKTPSGKTPIVAPSHAVAAKENAA